ncbi:hypothetical protein MBM_09853 [Drepanopeziza brunnea f. sp. 'multigermtubi' MB_m1]|uniref:Uncharacterized protein n=1 Tax=Marssonina brunnea f. sp. multigermtubi (strain MB_m1) TaxID=1072389 RepID=K1W4Z2_MARBU|nr:uncharacterized protein MBM_09853 [Drepanopeziza brunnea f. sp. 'multigermtubi' MB_m1]EKD11990.1 hypothetical protein MBM_09853 [Drepanopeziza brunnea f. sp. 'multigermtubi' MB_m1]
MSSTSSSTDSSATITTPRMPNFESSPLLIIGQESSTTSKASAESNNMPAGPESSLAKAMQVISKLTASLADRDATIARLQAAVASLKAENNVWVVLSMKQYLSTLVARKKLSAAQAHALGQLMAARWRGKSGWDQADLAFLERSVESCVVDAAAAREEGQVAGARPTRKTRRRWSW